jgi:hypothetical protein
MVDDVWDTWPHIKHLMDVAQKWYPHIAPGTWPDCDMIPLGRISIRGERGEDRMTRLTKEEQYTLITFFNIFKSPLFFGGDLPSNDAFTLSLLTNKEVVKMHNESTAVKQLFQKDGKIAVTSKNAKDGSTYLALFNISDANTEKVSVNTSELNLSGKLELTNLWTGDKTTITSGEITVELKPHSSVLYKIKSKK